MTNFIIKKLPYDLSSHAGLAFVGQYLDLINLEALIDQCLPMRSGVRNSAIVKCFLALLSIGKSDFDAIENFRNDHFFHRALNLKSVPSSSTLRQRMDAFASKLFPLIALINKTLLQSTLNGKTIDFGTLPCGYTPIDIDTFAMDNSQTKKENVGRTYAGVDGYCPAATYLGTHGYCLELELRPGVQHSAAKTENNFDRVLPLATELVATPLLVRADSGLCSTKLMQSIAVLGQKLKREIAFIIKWNPRKTPVEDIARQKVANAQTAWKTLRVGKRECVWEETVNVPGVSTPDNPARRVYRLTERTIDKRGQKLLVPENVLEGWTTTLPQQYTQEDIIALYADHGTHEQFHSEFKSDMDLERLPSGKFDTNYLVCQMAAVVLNLLRLIGQHALLGADSPVRHTAKRRRVKTVMQEIICKAGRMIYHAGRWVLGLGKSDRGFDVFQKHYKELVATG